MAKAVIFPLNNKGGVGKTSVLVDLMSMLSLHYRVGMLDMDGQATMYGTLTGDYAKGHLRATDYAGLETRIVKLHDNTEFRFAMGSKRMRISINEANAPLSLFPVGTIYEAPSSKQRLESIVREDMKNADIIAVDLPPIPHPGLILDHSLLPVCSILSEQSDKPMLFPLMIATPEKNTVEICLRGFQQCYDYLISRGFGVQDIHPIMVVNKVKIGFNERNRIVYGTMDEHDRKVLGDLGIIHDASRLGKNSTFYGFRRSFKYNGRRYRSFWIPLMEGLRGGGFSLFSMMKPELFNFPALNQQVVDTGFYFTDNATDLQRVYSEEMGNLCSFVMHYFRKSIGRNYSVYRSEPKRCEAKTGLVRDIKTGLTDVYKLWEDGIAKKETFYPLGGIRIQHRPRDFLRVRMNKCQIDLQALVSAIAVSERELGLKLGYLDEEWRQGDEASISAHLKSGGDYENELLKVDTHGKYTNLEVRFEEQFTPVPPDVQKERSFQFLEYLDKALCRRRAGVQESSHS